MAATGWTIRHIEEECTLHDLKLMNKHWARHPPLYLLMEKFVGWETPRAKDGFTGADLTELPGVSLG